MRSLAGMLALLLAMCAVARGDDPEPAVPRPFAATYAVSYRGISAGTITFELARDPATGHHRYETRASPRALARLFVSRAALERSVLAIDAAGVRPLHWQLDDGKTGSADDGELHFDWTRKLATGEIEGEPIELPLEPGTQDRSSIQIAVATALLRGREPGTIPLIDDHRIKHYTYTRKQTAALDSTLGKLDTVLYESTREGSSRMSRFWLAPRLEYLPVRAEQLRKGKVETVMVLTALDHPQ